MAGVGEADPVLALGCGVLAEAAEIASGGVSSTSHPGRPFRGSPILRPKVGATITIDPGAPFQPLGPRPDALHRAAEFLSFWLGPLLRRGNLLPL